MSTGTYQSSNDINWIRTSTKLRYGEISDLSVKRLIKLIYISRSSTAAVQKTPRAVVLFQQIQIIDKV